MTDLDIARLARIIADLDVQRHRLVGLLQDMEAERAVRAGTLAQPDPDTPTQITHDVPPDAPR